MASFGIKVEGAVAQRLENGIRLAPFTSAATQAVAVPLATVAVSGLLFALFATVLGGDVRFGAVLARGRALRSDPRRAWRRHHPLWHSLRTMGLVRPDPLRLGVETSDEGALIGADGRASVAVYYVGPFLKARDWEATAVEELRRYARGLAEHLLASLVRS